MKSTFSVAVDQQWLEAQRDKLQVNVQSKLQVPSRKLWLVAVAVDVDGQPDAPVIQRGRVQPNCRVRPFPAEMLLDQVRADTLFRRATADETVIGGVVLAVAIFSHDESGHDPLGEFLGLFAPCMFLISKLPGSGIEI